MGGPGSGGERPGAGRKRREPIERFLEGKETAGERELLNNPPPMVPVAQPFNLSAAEQSVWDELYPLAQLERTLTPATTNAFRMLCEAIAMRREVAKTIAIDGLTVDTPLGVKAHPLLTQYRGLTQRIEAGLVRFRLSPIGKPLIEDPRRPKKARDDFDEFEKGRDRSEPDDDDSDVN